MSDDKRNKTYYLVNPSGAIHEVDYDHAKNRLRQLGYRMATADEVAVYRETKVQRFDDPIARPWSPEPEPEIDVPSDTAQTLKRVDATDSALELAKEQGLDLRGVVGSGAGGRIVKADVEALVGH